MRSIALIARTIMERKRTDYHISFWKVVILAIPTLGIYNIITYYRLMKRIQKHYERQHMLYRDLMSYLHEFASTKEIYMEGLTKLKCEISEVEFEEEALKPGIWTIISIATLGLGGMYPLYRITVDPFRHDKLEDQIFNMISSILCDVGILKQPITKRNHCKKRSFILYIFLTILTLGLFSLYWTYVIVNDLNKHFNEHDNWEDKLLRDLSNF